MKYHSRLMPLWAQLPEIIFYHIIHSSRWLEHFVRVFLLCDRCLLCLSLQGYRGIHRHNHPEHEKLHQPQVSNDFLSVFITSLDCGLTIASACLCELCIFFRHIIQSYRRLWRFSALAVDILNGSTDFPDVISCRRRSSSVSLWWVGYIVVVWSLPNLSAFTNLT